MSIIVDYADLTDKDREQVQDIRFESAFGRWSEERLATLAEDGDIVAHRELQRRKTLES